MRNISILLIILLFCSCNSKDNEINHIDFLKEQNKSAKDYIISSFKEHDIVILCERNHKEFTQYELFLEIVKDPYFIENVGYIFTEVGVANMGDEINTFLHSEQKDSASTRDYLTSVFRNIDSSPYWHCYSYPWFLGELFKINQNLAEDKKLMLYPSDSDFDWAKCNTGQEFKKFDNSITNRDSTMAQNIINKFEIIQSGAGQRKKALVIMNYSHAFLKDHILSGNIVKHNTGRYLSDKYKDKVASVYIMGLAYPQYGNYTLVKDGKWDYYFEITNKTNIGFNLANTPFGIEEFDVTPPDSIVQLKYSDMFTGLIFYKTVQEHKLITGWEDYTTNEFVPELKRRMHIFNEAEELGMTEKDIEQRLFENNNEKTTQYRNIKILRDMIEDRKNGL